MDSRPPVQILQFREDGFSFNRLRPYEGFDSYQEAIANGWEFYRTRAKPKLVSRLSMRFINRIELPFGDESVLLTDYLRFMRPAVPAENQQLAGIFQTLRFRCTKSSAFSQVTIATQDASETSLPVVLDIETYLDLNRPPDPFEEFANELDCLRRLKNEIFRNSLTPECLQQFQLS